MGQNLSREVYAIGHTFHIGFYGKFTRGVIALKSLKLPFDRTRWSSQDIFLPSQSVRFAVESKIKALALPNQSILMLLKKSYTLSNPDSEHPQKKSRSIWSRIS